jgi:ferrous iron transport protein A
LQVAPLKDPLYINVNGSHIAIRRSMAKLIELDILEDTSAV